MKTLRRGDLSTTALILAVCRTLRLFYATEAQTDCEGESLARVQNSKGRWGEGELICFIISCCVRTSVSSLGCLYTSLMCRGRSSEGEETNKGGTPLFIPVLQARTVCFQNLLTGLSTRTERSLKILLYLWLLQINRETFLCFSFCRVVPEAE